MRSEHVAKRFSSGGVHSAAAMRAAEASADLPAVQPWDHGVRRYTNLRMLQGFPLVAIVGLARMALT
jgi:hypothetical protein